MDKIGLLGIIGMNEGGSGTSNYNDLSNKPSINGIELTGNKSAADLGITGGNKIYRFVSSHFGGLSESEMADLQEIVNNRLAGEDSIIFIDDIIVDRIFTIGSFLLMSLVNLNTPTDNRVKVYRWDVGEDEVRIIQDYNLAVQTRAEAVDGATYYGDEAKAFFDLLDWLNVKGYGMTAVPDEYAIYLDGNRAVECFLTSPNSYNLYANRWDALNGFYRDAYDVSIITDDDSSATIGKTDFEYFSADSQIADVVCDSDAFKYKILDLIQSDWEIQEAIRQIIEG